MMTYFQILNSRILIFVFFLGDFNSTYDLIVLNLVFKPISFFYTIICSFYVAFHKLIDIEAPRNRENIFIRKSDPDFI